MRTIWKHPLREVDGPQVVTAPGQWRVLHVATQDEQPTLWIEVDTDSQVKWDRPFHVIGTGHPVEPWLTYVGTCHLPPFVWHVYEAREDPTVTDQPVYHDDYDDHIHVAYPIGDPIVTPPALRPGAFAIPTPQPRQEPCTHPVRQRTSRDGHVVHETCRLCDAHLVTDRQTGQTTTEVTG